MALSSSAGLGSVYATVTFCPFFTGVVRASLTLAPEMVTPFTSLGTPSDVTEKSLLAAVIAESFLS